MTVTTLNNRSGIIVKRMNLGNQPYEFTFTYGQGHWYADIKYAGSLIRAGLRVCAGRVLLETPEGKLYPGDDVSMTGFNKVVWYEAEDL